MKKSFVTYAFLGLYFFSMPVSAMNGDQPSVQACVATETSPSIWRSFPVPSVSGSDDEADRDDSALIAPFIEDCSDSSCSESDEDIKSRKFFLYIPNQYAAAFYQRSVNRDLSLYSCGREGAKTRSFKKFCTVMTNVRQRFNATQSLDPAYESVQNGLIVELTTQHEQSLKAVADCCQISEYVAFVSPNKEDVERRMQIRLYNKTVRSAQNSLNGSCRMRALAAELQSVQLGARVGSADESSESEGYVDSCIQPTGAAKAALDRQIDEYLMSRPLSDSARSQYDE